MRIANVDRIESGGAATAALCQRRIDRVAFKVQAPVLRKRRDELHRAIANFTSPKIKSVEGSIRRDQVENTGPRVNNRGRRDPVWAKECALISAFTRQHDRSESVGPQFFARLRVQGKYSSSNPCDVDDAAQTPDCRDI